MGRTPEPTAIKIAKGNPGKRPINKAEPKPTISIPCCPEFLSKEAKIEWERVTPELKRLGLISNIDTASLACYCEAYSDLQAAIKTLNSEGTILVAASGYKQQHPAVSFKKQAMEQIKKFSAEFGLTPSSRSRISVDIKPDDLSGETEEQQLAFRLLS